MENEREYLPVIATIEDELRAEFPLLSGERISNLADNILTSLTAKGMVPDLASCERRLCTESAIFGTNLCVLHTDYEENRARTH